MAFLCKQISLKDIILGNHRFGTWKNHFLSWSPKTRPNTLFLRYEDLTSDFESVLNSLSNFLNVDLISKKFPSRDQVSFIDGRWVRQKTNWRDEISNDELDLFKKISHPISNELGYE